METEDSVPTDPRRGEWRCTVCGGQQHSSFCRKARLVELPPNGEVRFESGYTFRGKPPEFVFMFGNPAGYRDESLVLVSVQSTSELRMGSAAGKQKPGR